jgi:truncated hemoglobin YjbI
MACPVSGHFSVLHGRHPVQLLNDRAEELSGVTFEEAMQIDDVNVTTKIGELAMLQMSERFLKHVMEDSDEEFKSMFSGREDFAQDQADYLLQRLGGPSYFSDRKGNGQLIERHSRFAIDAPIAEKWLAHMSGALEETEEVKPGQRELIRKYLRFTAYFIVAAQESTAEMRAIRPLTKDTPEDVPAPVYAKAEVSAEDLDKLKKERLLLRQYEQEAAAEEEGTQDWGEDGDDSDSLS